MSRATFLVVWFGLGILALACGSSANVVSERDREETAIAYALDNMYAPEETEMAAEATRELDLGYALYRGGGRAKLCGPVVSTVYAYDEEGQPTFLNLFAPYPDPNRSVVVIWGPNRGNFTTAPELAYQGRTICVIGEAREYEGIVQIEVNNSSQIEVQP